MSRRVHTSYGRVVICILANIFVYGAFGTTGTNLLEYILYTCVVSRPVSMLHYLENWRTHSVPAPATKQKRRQMLQMPSFWNRTRSRNSLQIWSCGRRAQRVLLGQREPSRPESSAFNCRHHAERCKWRKVGTTDPESTQFVQAAPMRASSCGRQIYRLIY